MLRLASVTGVLIAAAACASSAQETASPESLGFTADGLAALDAYFAEQVENEVRAGYVIGVARDGRLVHTFAVGMADIEAGAPMTLDTQFRLASMSKPVTVVAALRLVDEGRLDLDDPVSVYVPHVANMLVATSPARNADGAFDLVPPDPAMTVRNLMTHTSGMSYPFGGATDIDAEWAAHSPFNEPVDLKTAVNEIALSPLHAQPGERWIYGVSIDVLGRVVEVASGMPLEDYMQTAIFDPLGMSDTHFYVRAGDARSYAVIYGADESGAFTPIEPTIFGTGSESWPGGGGGLFSTMPDYIKFASMLANGGELDGVRILSPEAVAMMGSAQVAPSAYPQPGANGQPGTFLGWSLDGRGFGLGVQVTTDEALTPQVDRNGDFGWNGAYSTDWFASPSTGVAAVIMLQSSGPNRPPQNVGMDLRQYVYGAMAAE